MHLALIWYILTQNVTVRKQNQLASGPLLIMRLNYYSKAFGSVGCFQALNYLFVKLNTKSDVSIIQKIPVGVTYTRQTRHTARRINQLSERSQAMEQFRLYWFKGMSVNVTYHIFASRSKNM